MKKINTRTRLLSAFVAVMFTLTMLGAFPAIAAPQFGGFDPNVDQSGTVTPGTSQTTETPKFGGVSEDLPTVTPSESTETEKPDLSGGIQFDPADVTVGNTVYLNAPDGTNLKGMKVSAYQVLTESTDVNGYKEYRVTADFVEFFNKAGYIEAAKEAKGTVYVTYDADNNQLKYSTKYEYGAIRVSDDLDTGDFFEANLLAEILGEGDKNGMATKAADAQTISEYLRRYVKANDIEPGVTKTAKNGQDSITLPGLNDGYWFILSENAPAGVANVKTVLKATDGEDYRMDLKAEYPKFEKTVENNGESFDDGHGAFATVGDVLDYKISFAAHDMSEYTDAISFGLPEKYQSLYTFVIKDTMEHQVMSPSYFENDEDEEYPYYFMVTFEEFGQSVKFVDLTLAELRALELDGDYYPLSWIATVKNNGFDFELDFKVDQLQKLWTNNLVEAKFGQNVTLTVEYKAELTSDAVTKNGNHAEIEYSNDPKVPDQTVEDDDDTDVFTYGLNIDKKFSDGKGNFEDVVFNLYKAVQSTAGGFGLFDGALWDNFLGNGSSKNPAAPVVKKDGDAIVLQYNGEYYHTLDSYSTDHNLGIDLKLDKDGNLNIFGLAPGLYILEEVSTSDGYKLADKIVIWIDADGDTHVMKLGGVWEGSTWLNPVVDEENGRQYFDFEVLNQKGFDLPSTGGMGILLFGIGGVLLIAAAAYILLSQRKREEA